MDKNNNNRKLFNKIEKKIGSDKIEEFWNGDKKKKIKTEYFGVGDLEVSYNDKLLVILI